MAFKSYQSKILQACGCIEHAHTQVLEYNESKMDIQVGSLLRDRPIDFEFALKPVQSPAHSDVASQKLFASIPSTIATHVKISSTHLTKE